MCQIELSDEQWQRVEGLLPGQPGSPGAQRRQQSVVSGGGVVDRSHGSAVARPAGTFGDWNSVFQRFNRWAKRGVWQRAFDALQEPDLEWVMFEATIIRAHVPAADARKKVETNNSAGRVVVSAPRFTRPAKDWVTR